MTGIIIDILIRIFIGIVVGVIVGIIIKILTGNTKMLIAFAIPSLIITTFLAFVFSPLETSPVPNVIHLYKVLAEEEVKKAGFKPQIKEEHNEIVEKFRVIHQTPKGGTPIRRGSEVEIIVSLGPRPQPPGEEPPSPEKEPKEEEPISAIFLENQERKLNITLTEEGSKKEEMVRGWLEEDPAYIDLAKKTLKMLKGRNPKGNAVPLDVLEGHYRKLKGKRSDEYIRPPHDLKTLENAYVITWKERNTKIPGWEKYKLNDIAPISEGNRSTITSVNQSSDGSITTPENFDLGRHITAQPRSSMNVKGVIKFPRSCKSYWLGFVSSTNNLFWPIVEIENSGMPDQKIDLVVSIPSEFDGGDLALSCVSQETENKFRDWLSQGRDSPLKKPSEWNAFFVTSVKII